MHLDFSNQDLRKRNFQGKDLSGANFSHSNIRGTNFTSANLSEAKFTGSKAGLTRQWEIRLIAIYVCLAIISTFASLGSISVLRNEFSNDFFEDHAPALYLFLASALIFWTITVTRKGIIQGFIVLLGALFPVGLLAVVGSSALASYDFILVSLSRAIGGALFIGVIVTVVLSLLFSAIEKVTVVSRLRTVVSIVLLGGVIGSILRVLARNGSQFLTSTTSWNWAWIDLIWGCSWTCLLVFLGSHLSFNIINETPQMIAAKRITIAMASIQGTSFRKANLTNADFSQATLKNADLRAAKLNYISWFEASGLTCARVGDSYLNDSRMQQLLITLQGQGEEFNGLSFEDLNLKKANLQDASFIGANFNNANLQNANLSRAILKQTKLAGADLTGADLTGAYIEDWGITSTTKLDNMHCEYVFMRVPNKENPNPLRKPDNWQETFASGEFADFIQPYFDTLDLYHSQDVDPRAISVAFKKMSQNHPEANLEIVAMEKRGQNSFNLKVRTAPEADKSKLSLEYFADYNQLKALSEARLLLLTEKDDRIHSLEQMIQTALYQPTFNVKTVQGDFMPENKGISINAGDNASISGVSSGDGIVNLGTISGNVTNAINQLPDSSEAGQASLKVLLTQLQNVIETDTDLPDPDKSDLLEQVQSLAEAKQIEESTKREGIARKAIKMFDATLKSLPDTAKIVEACSKLLPLILRALGIPS